MRKGTWRLRAGVVSDIHHFMLRTVSLAQEGGAKREKIELANEQLAATEWCSQQGQQATDGLAMCSLLCLCFNLSLYIFVLFTILKVQVDHSQ